MTEIRLLTGHSEEDVWEATEATLRRMLRRNPNATPLDAIRRLSLALDRMMVTRAIEKSMEAGGPN